MSYKSDVKPVTLTANGAFFTGRTRVRAIMAQLMHLQQLRIIIIFQLLLEQLMLKQFIYQKMVCFMKMV